MWHALLGVAAILPAVLLTIAMWAFGRVPFDIYTSTMHLLSIYIGAVAVLTVRDWRDRLTLASVRRRRDEVGSGPSS